MQHLHAPVEVKTVDDAGQFEGYASVYGIEDLDGDVIERGAFSDSVARFASGKRPKMLWQHDGRDIVGKWLAMSEDERGLHVKGKLFLDIERGREAHVMMREGELDAMSVGFNIVDAAPGERRGGRRIKRADLWEVSLVTWGANPEARIDAVKARQTIRNFEKWLRDVGGFSGAEAKAIAADGYKGLAGRDVAGGSDELDGLLSALRNLQSSMKG